MRTRFLAVSGRYRKEDDGVTLELYGRCEDNRSITALYRGFWPYFFIVEPGEEVKQDLSNDPMVRELREESLWETGKDRRCLRVEITYPFEVPKYRKRWQEKGYRILAADIPFVYRYFYDLDLGTYLQIDGQEVNSNRYSTDLVMDISDIKAVEPFDVRLKVLSFDIENSIKTGEIYTIGYSVSEFPLPAGDVSGSSIALDPKEGWGALEGERKMIDDLASVIRDEDPDIITGYNIDGYDIPHVLKRDNILDGKGLNWGRDGGMIEKVGYRTWKITGRIVVDAWWEAKKAFRPKKETLMAVSRLLLGEGKDDIDTSRIEEEWETRREEVIRYCVKDSVLALRILNKTNSIQRGMELAYVARLPLVDVLSGTTSTLIDSILIRKADRAGIGIPLTKHEKKSSKIEGAYVHAVEPGLYDWVVVLDFRSMYPSLMIEKNICFTTFTRDAEAGNTTPLDDVFYLPKNKRMGLVPDILQDLMDQRQDAKSRMRSAKTEDESRFLDGLQDAIKVLMNSFYGVFASYFYRFT
ncbi:MAG: DNA polymerase II, partial [Thermoplasmata archaeon]|nr:DNA polymerase II [Thermoplasmata archaeon]